MLEEEEVEFEEEEEEFEEVRERICSTVFWTAVVTVGSCFARVSESVKREESVPV